MKVIVIIKATAGSEAGQMPNEQLLTEMGKFNEELVSAGIMLAGEGLKPSSEGARVHFSGANRTVAKGPFTATTELVAGYWLWEVTSMEEAIDWVKRCPNPMLEDSDIEIRPLFEMDDFGEEFTPELREQEDKIRRNAAATEANDDEKAILDLMAKWRAALMRKDVDAMMEDYADTAVLFDAIPPYKTVGVAGIKAAWQSCLPYFPASFDCEHRDVTIHVNGDTAIAYGLHRFIPDDPDHPCGMTWMRLTIGYSRLAGKWKVVHEHISIPFNPMNNQSWPITDPGKLDAPDYSAGTPDSGEPS